jgi:hypothetical protein
MIARAYTIVAFALLSLAGAGVLGVMGWMCLTVTKLPH